MNKRRQPDLISQPSVSKLLACRVDRTVSTGKHWHRAFSRRCKSHKTPQSARGMNLGLGMRWGDSEQRQAQVLIREKPLFESGLETNINIGSRCYYFYLVVMVRSTPYRIINSFTLDHHGSSHPARAGGLWSRQCEMSSSSRLVLSLTLFAVQAVVRPHP